MYLGHTLHLEYIHSIVLKHLVIHETDMYFKGLSRNTSKETGLQAQMSALKSILTNSQAIQKLMYIIQAKKSSWTDLK